MKLVALRADASVVRARDEYLQQANDLHITSVIIPTSEKPPAFGCFGFTCTDIDLRNSVDGVLMTFICGAKHCQMMSEFGFFDEDVDRLP